MIKLDSEYVQPEDIMEPGGKDVLWMLNSCIAGLGELHSQVVTNSSILVSRSVLLRSKTQKWAASVSKHFPLKKLK